MTAAVNWYERPEKQAPWRVAACAAHGAELERFRFRLVGPELRYLGEEPLPAKFCAFAGCAGPGTLRIREVERCTCETAPSRCPSHRARPSRRSQW